MSLTSPIFTSSCSVIIKGKAVNLGDGEGMQVPCKLRLSGAGKFVNVLQKELDNLEQWWWTTQIREHFKKHFID